MPASPEPSKSLISLGCLVVAVIFPVIATVAVVLRLYARRITTQAFKADDWTIVFSLFTTWLISINTFVCAGLAGIGTTKLDRVSSARYFLLCLWLEGFPNRIGLAAIKISILLFYRRIFITPAFNWCTKIMIIILIAWGISGFFTQLLAGNPISSVYDPLVTTLRFDYQASAQAVAGMSLVFDVIVLCFPLPIIKNLRMAPRRKLSVIGILWLGGFCCIAASMRIYFLWHSERNSAGSKDYEDATQGLVWTQIEPSCSILAACLPIYGPLVTGELKFLGSVGSFFAFIGSSISSGVRYSRRHLGISGHESVGSDNIPLETPRQRERAKKVWQELDKSDRSAANNHVEIAAFGKTVAPGKGDVESGVCNYAEIPMSIEVTKSFGSASREK